MRDGFREITAGWMLTDDLHDLHDRIERVAAWAADGNLPLESDERATLLMMIESQFIRAFRAFGLGVPSL